MLRAIDDFIFDRFPAIQKISSLVEYFTHANHVSQAQLIVIIGTAYNGSRAYGEVLAGDLSGWKTLGLLGIIVILFIIQAQIHGNYSNSRVGFRNHLRMSNFFMWFRIAFLVLSFGRLIQAVYGDQYAYPNATGTFSIVLAYYFLACDKLPPGHSFWDRFRKTEGVTS